MIKVYVTADPLMIGYLSSILTAHGIESFIKNEHLPGAAGELPPTEVWPELWVMEDNDAGAARRIIEEVLSEKINADGWQCPHCGEHIEGQFNECWRCSGDESRLP